VFIFPTDLQHCDSRPILSCLTAVKDGLYRNIPRFSEDITATELTDESNSVGGGVVNSEECNSAMVLLGFGSAGNVWGDQPLVIFFREENDRFRI